MSRLLVQVQELSPKDGLGQIELTWQSSRMIKVPIESSTGWHEHDGVEDFSEAEVLSYSDAAERASIMRQYTPDRLDGGESGI